VSLQLFLVDGIDLTAGYQAAVADYFRRLSKNP